MFRGLGSLGFAEIGFMGLCFRLSRLKVDGVGGWDDTLRNLAKCYVMLGLYMSLEIQATAAKTTQSCKSSWGRQAKRSKQDESYQIRKFRLQTRNPKHRSP